MKIKKLINGGFLLFTPDKGDGGGEGDDGNQDGGHSDRGAAAFQQALDRRNNDGVALARELFDDNYQYRHRIQRLTKDLDAAKKVPEGTILLSVDEAKEWAAYKALGKPDAIKTTVDEHGQYKDRLTTLQRESILRDVADKAKYKFSVLQNADLLSKAKGKDLEYIVKDVEKDGVKTPTAFVKDGDTERPLAEYAQENWADLLPSLPLTQETNTNSQNKGTYYPPQHQGSGGGNKANTPKAQTEATLNKKYQSPSRADK
jgi:hypothetical protein